MIAEDFWKSRTGIVGFVTPVLGTHGGGMSPEEKAERENQRR
jgi:hypothetical protein